MPTRPILCFSILVGISAGAESYFGDYPCLDDEIMDYILNDNYKGIGFDIIGLNPIADANLPPTRNCLPRKKL